MENTEKIRQANMVGHLIRTIGVLFFIAMAFQILTWKYAMFGGVACFIIAPVIRKMIADQ